MKFTTITFMERKNKGNYEHEELTASALLEEGDDFVAASLNLKLAVHNVLYGIVNTSIIKQEEIIEEQVKEEPKAAKKQKKEKVEEPKSEVDSANIPPVIPEVVKEEKPKATKVVKYDSNVPEHKSLFGGFLQKKYDTKWKTVGTPEEIKRFTSSLNGQDFLDDKGQIVPSFVEQVLTFFGA